MMKLRSNLVIRYEIYTCDTLGKKAFLNVDKNICIIIVYHIISLIYFFFLIKN